MSTSSSPAERLLRVPIARLYPHPENANQMSEVRRAKLRAQIARNDRYPPLIARPHPSEPDAWQLLDGHQRRRALEELGHREVWVFPWPCDDETARLLLATLNRLEGEDVPARRAALLAELTAVIPAEDLADLIPESAAEINETLALLDDDIDALLAELHAAADAGAAAGTQAITFAVPAADVPAVEAAITAAAVGLTGPNRRGRALVALCRAANGEARDA